MNKRRTTAEKVKQIEQLWDVALRISQEHGTPRSSGHTCLTQTQTQHQNLTIWHTEMRPPHNSDWLDIWARQPGGSDRKVLNVQRNLNGPFDVVSYIRGDWERALVA